MTETALRRRRITAVAIVLILAISLAGLLSFVRYQSVRLGREQEFNIAAERITADLSQHFQILSTILRAGRGLFLSSVQVSRSEWERFVNDSDLVVETDGIQGIGFAKFLEPGEVAGFEEEVRSEGFPDFKVTPEGERDEYTIIVFLEPFDERNRRAFGYDMSTEETRKTAMMS
ncbi:CHASE domain-containing protein, partial [Candidatus Dojkabacteria bacterium]|nr:CHASE domain-containing protein [Candidatus Dojkabacteria bacterium]